MTRIAWLTGALLLLGTGCVVPTFLCPEAVIQVYPDADGDGHGAVGSQGREVCGSVPQGYSKVADDCDDQPGAGARRHPGAEEVCDGLDNDCDGQVDEGLSGVAEVCDGLDNNCDGRVDEGLSSAEEVCDGVDNDCDGQVDEGLSGIAEVCDGIDNDCDGQVDEGLSGVAEVCDGLDNDCDGQVDEGLAGVEEVCDGVDNNCDGRVDEGVMKTFYPDKDGDGVGAGAPVLACFPPTAHVAVAGDCDDNDSRRAPGKFERLDGLDNNCSGTVDEAFFSAGDEHAVALRQDGTLLSWGCNTSGGLGDGTTVSREVPMAVPGLSQVIAVATGRYHTVALKQDGTVWTWGSNTWGQLGLGTSVSSASVPSLVPGLTEVMAISAGLSHSMALKRDGTVWTWGYNASGQLGDGTLTHRFKPLRVTGLSDVVSISAGSSHSVALLRDGMVWTWGENGEGQLGDWMMEDRPVPGEVWGLMGGVTAVDSHGDHTLALRWDGTVWAWGRNDSGQLGNGTNMPVEEGAAQVLIPTGVEFTAVFGGGRHSVALDRDGNVWVWGSSAFGQLGSGSSSSRWKPMQLTGVADVVSLAAGGSNTLAVKRDGTFRAWGRNQCGQVGDGTKVDRTVPTEVPALNYSMGND
ncbi:hypothetical protein LZ198_03135 [Myxococcus sp. K15C18031901]|uniref:RCC1 domain-containing protein n=1 Tax=Myxococcus dinghuensis TaxID=2906761 RepID=UPI0020A7C1CC|nr:MopE-related protein [Myxococcus dinghuensis]MCP3097865.1 hypothetical protein [Myxococcus dinghuensis]